MLKLVVPVNAPLGKDVWETGLAAALVQGTNRRVRNVVQMAYTPEVGNDLPGAENMVFVNAGP